MIQTVCGTITPERLGVTLLHEHIICGSPVFYRGFGENWAERQQMAVEAVMQIKEAVKLYNLQTIVDGTPFALSRDVTLLKEVAEKAGVNIIASTGYYVACDYGLHEIPAEIQAAYFIDECNAGIEGTGIRPGFLKCATNANTSLRSVEIMAMVQKETCLPLFAHSDAAARTGLKQLDVFERHKLNPGKIIIGHTSDTHDLEYVEKLLQRGCYVCIDRLYQQEDVAAKARMILELAERGWLARLTVGHDHICWKMEQNRKQQKKNGGGWPRETHLNNIGDMLLPELRRLGAGSREIEQLLVTNPRAVWR